MSRLPFALLLLASLFMLSFVGCDTGSGSGGSGSSGSGSGNAKVKVEFPEGDVSVTPEDGGPGFDDEGWATNEVEPIGDPRAIKGGAMLSSIPTWPDNLRMYGTRSNTYLNYLVRDLCYESLLKLDPRTLDFLPSLASHWKISDDKMTFTFRIDPRAHWSDGKPVVADDVIATYRLLADDTLVAPMSKATIVDKMEEPVAKSKYIVEIKAKVKDWRNFISIGGMILLPAHEIGDITGEKYLDEYNFKYTAFTGPYEVRQEDVKSDQSITITRRSDYWGASDPVNKYINNIDKIRFVIVRDRRLAFDKLCKGELDFNVVYTAKWWVDDLGPMPAVEKGHLVRQKVYTKYPQGFQGAALNMRDPPLNDLRVRLALAHLYDRTTMLDKFAYNEYVQLSSYFPGSDGENQENQLVAYDPEKAVQLLSDAGWTERGPDGILVKDGKRLSIKYHYMSPVFEKYLTVFKEACKQAGVEVNLERLDPATRWSNMQDRKFQMTSAPWGAILFPNPRTSWHSSQSEKTGSNNVTGLKSDEADRLIEAYDAEFDKDKRNELLRQLDAEIFRHHPYVLDWYAPSQRLLYWNKFGTPDTVLLKYHEWDDVFSLWWVDPEKKKLLEDAEQTGAKLEIPEAEVKPW